MDPNQQYPNLNDPTQPPQPVVVGPDTPSTIPQVPGGLAPQQQPALDPNQWFQPSSPIPGPTPGSAQPLPQAYTSPPPKSHKKLIFCLLLIIIIVLGVGGFFGYKKLAGPDTKQAAATADSFISTVYVSPNYNTYKQVAPDDKVSEADYNDTIKIYKEEAKTTPARHDIKITKKDNRTFAIATYSYETKSDKYNHYQVAVLMEKKNGKWLVADMEEDVRGYSTDAYDYDSYLFDKSLGANLSGYYPPELDSSSTDAAASDKDVERQTDIKALHGQVEAYYAQYGKYPTLANLNDPNFVASNMKGLDTEALKDPDGTEKKLAAAPAAKTYSYEVTAEDGSACDNTTKDCTKYTLTATLDGGGTFVKSNLN